jgi:hypothetical protein
MEELAEEVQTLADLLGDDHDLVVLRGKLTCSSDEFGGQARLQRLCSIIDRRRHELKVQAFALGQRLYTDKPKDFTGGSETIGMHGGRTLKWPCKVNRWVWMGRLRRNSIGQGRWSRRD